MKKTNLKRPPWLCIALLSILILAAVSGCSLQKKIEARLSGAGGPKLDPDAYATYHFSMARLEMDENDFDAAAGHLNKSLSVDPDSVYLHLTLADTYMAMKRLDDAEAEAQKALELKPEQADPFVILGAIYLSENKPAQAEDILRQGLLKNPAKEELINNLADALLRQNKPDQAMQVLVEFLRARPDSVPARYIVAQLLLRANQPAQAEVELFRILQYDPTFYPALRDLIEMYITTEQYDKAIAALAQLLTFFPGDHDSRSEMVQLLLKKNDLDMALYIMELGKGTGDEIPDWWIRSGQIYLHRQQFDRARLEFEDLLNHDPENSTAHFYLGLIDLKDEKPGSAVEHFQKVKADSEVYPDAMQRLAYIYFKQEQTEQAIDILKAAIEKYPTSPELYLQLSGIYMSREQYDQAMSVVNDGLAKQPQNPDLSFQMGTIYELKGDHEQSVGIMERILKANPKSAKVLNFIGYTMADQGQDLDQAEDYIKSALALEPDAAYIQDSMGWLLYRKGKTKEALDWLLKAYKKEPNDPEINEHLGDVYLGLKDAKSAKEHYQKALQNKPRTVIRERIDKKLGEM